MIIFFTFTMLTTVLARTSSIKAICRLCPTRSSPSVWTALPRSAPQIINKNDGRTYATKQGNNITNIFERNRSATLRIFSSSEQNRKYSSNKLEIKSTATELTEEVEDAGEEIPLLEINESYLDTQKQSMEQVLRRDLQARDVKVYDFRDLNLTSNCGVSFEIEVWCAGFKDKTLLQQHRMVIDTLQRYNKANSSAKEQLLDVDNFHSIVIRTHV